MDELYRTSPGATKCANRTGAPPAIAGAWLGSVRRFTDNTASPEALAQICSSVVEGLTAAILT